MKTYKFKVSYEDLISRLTSLFPYMEINEKQECVLHQAIDSPNGCYGKIIPYLKYNDVSYPYRFLIDYYYRHKNDNEKDGITKFVEKGIGKKNFEGKTAEMDLAPDYIYLGCATKLYSEMLNLERQCNFYGEHHKNTDLDDNELCCKCELYRRKGGDVYKNFLETCVAESKLISEEYLTYADKDKLTINFNVYLSQSSNDMGITTSTVQEWIPGKLYRNGDKVIYNEVLYQLKKNVMSTTGRYNTETELIEFDIENWFVVYENNEYYETKLIKYKDIQTDSKLTALRRYRNYMTLDSKFEKPLLNEDWLYYYVKGAIRNITVLNDDLGNICHFRKNKDGKYDPNIIADKNDADYEYLMKQTDNLVVYGDVLTDIVPDLNKNTITFHYYLNAHLKVEGIEVREDDDKNKLYYVKNSRYIIDLPEDKTGLQNGIHYYETYGLINNSELKELCKDSFNFNNYVKGVNVDIFKKYKFSTINNMLLKSKFISGKDFKYNSKIAYFTVDFDTIVNKINVDEEYGRNCLPLVDKKDNLIHLDFYNDISFSPTEKIDVFINRGNSNIIDKHIRFSEIKSLNDMVDYSNGSFFKMNEND